MRGDQLPLYEPTGAEVPALALQHVARADKARKQAEVARARGWQSVAQAYQREAYEQESEAECLAMLADFERLGGVRS